MKQNYRKRFLFAALLVVAPLLNIHGEEYRIFYDLETPQADFAAQEVASVLKQKSHTVRFLQLGESEVLSKSNNIVISHSSDALVADLYAAEFGAKEEFDLDEQAYVLRTTKNGGLNTFWALGADDRGVMYGGLSLAEKLQHHSDLSVAINYEEAPYIKKRGIKFNIPLDRRTPTYDSRGTAHIENRRIQLSSA